MTEKKEIAMRGYFDVLENIKNILSVRSIE